MPTRRRTARAILRLGRTKRRRMTIQGRLGRALVLLIALGAGVLILTSCASETRGASRAATGAGANSVDEVERMSERPEPSPRLSRDLCTEAKLEELLDRVVAKEWTTRPNEIAFGAFVDTAACRVVVQSDSFTSDEELALGELDPHGRILLELTEGPVGRRSSE